MVNLSPDAIAITAILARENIHNLYHFTDIENLPGIAEHNGLFSKQELELKGAWPCKKPGGNELSHGLDRRNEHWNLINLNFTPHTPMIYHKKSEQHLCFIVISPEVATWEGVVFTDSNAASNNALDGQHKGSGVTGLNLVHFDKVKLPITPWDAEWVTYVQAEVLVPEKIPLSMINEIVFVSEASKNEGERLWGSGSHPPFTIKRKLFSNDPTSNSPITGFSYVNSVKLINTLVNSDNVEQIQTHVPNFNRLHDQVISAVINVQATTGSKGKIVWGVNDKIEETEFATTGGYNWWSNISLNEISNGIYYAEIYMNNIKWSTVKYEVN